MQESQRFNSIIHRIRAGIGLIPVLVSVAAGQGIEDSGGKGWSVRIDSIRRAAGHIELSFPLLEHRTHAVERSADLKHWTVINHISGELLEERATVQLLLHPAEAGFFRVRMLNAPPIGVSFRGLCELCGMA